MSTKLYFRSGLNTIGGTIVEVINNENRLIFDFGSFYDPANKDQEVIPDVSGIYDNTSKYQDHVFISHLHLDHTKAMNLINNHTNIYMLNESKEFLLDLYTIGFDGFMGEKREYTGLEEGKCIEIGNFKVTMLKVDHDVRGAAAILIESPDITLFYSGDIRLHGLNNKYTYDTIEYIKNLESRVDVAIFEGVTISFIEDDYKITPTNVCTDEQLEKNFSNQVIERLDNEEHLLLINPYIMSHERLTSIFELGTKLNKKVCLTPKFAYLASKYFSSKDFIILGDNTYGLSYETIDYKDLNTNHLAIFEFSNINLYDIAIQNNQTALIQTGGEPLGAYDPNWEKLEKYCSNNNVLFIAYGASGHASPEHLLYIIEEINPKLLIPLHSFKPELVKSSKDDIIQLLPIKDKEYEFINHKLKS